MKPAPKQVQTTLEWSVLDVEEEEWEKRLGEQREAATNGFPCSPATERPRLCAYEETSSVGAHTLGIRRCLLLIGAALCVMGTLVGYEVWRTAQTGIIHLQDDMANVVKLEEVTARAKWPAARERESFVSVEFLDGSAMASVLVTKSVSGGMVNIHPEARFYTYTAKGWQRTAPIAAFWGPTAAIETASLHFDFGEKDRAILEQVAPVAEVQYARLRRATGLDLAQGGVLTIEIALDSRVGSGVYENGRIRMGSPLLYAVPPEQRGHLFTLLLRQALADALVDAVLRRTPVKAQWQPMLEGFHHWLWFSTALAPAPARAVDGVPSIRRGKVVPMSLSYLRGEASNSEARVDRPDEQYYEEQRTAAAAQLFDFIATAYGSDTVPRLLQGFAEYDDWETLAPAVLGVSAAELEAAWHATFQ